MSSIRDYCFLYHSTKNIEEVIQANAPTLNPSDTATTQLIETSRQVSEETFSKK